MNKKIPIMLASIFAMVLMLSLTTSVIATDYKTEFTSPFTRNIPELDGNISAGEYTDAAVTIFSFDPDDGRDANDVYIYVKNTNTTIYMAFDLTWDDNQDDDYISVAFDQNDDGVFINPYSDYGQNPEIWIDAWRETGNIYTSSPEVLYSFVWGFAESPNEDAYEHMIIEMSIQLTSFKYEDEALALGDTFGFYAQGEDDTSDMWIYPTDATDLWGMGYDEDDAADWAQITLGTYTAPVIVTPPPVVTPVNHAKDIGILVMVISGVIIVAGAIFRDALGKNYKYVIVFGLILLALGAANYVGEYVKTIPYIYE